MVDAVWTAGCHTWEPGQGLNAWRQLSSSAEDSAKQNDYEKTKAEGNLGILEKGDPCGSGRVESRGVRGGVRGGGVIGGVEAVLADDDLDLLRHAR